MGERATGTWVDRLAGLHEELDRRLEIAAELHASASALVADAEAFNRKAAGELEAARAAAREILDLVDDEGGPDPELARAAGDWHPDDRVGIPAGDWGATAALDGELDR